MKSSIAMALLSASVVFGNGAHAQCVGVSPEAGGAVDNRRSEGVSEQGITLAKSPPDMVVRIAHISGDMAQCAGKVMGGFAIDNGIVFAALGTARRTADAESASGEVIFAVCRAAANGSDALLLGAASDALVVRRHLDSLARTIPASREGGTPLQRPRRTQCRAPWRTYHGSDVERGTMAQCVSAARAVRGRNSTVASEDRTHFVLLAKDQQTTVAVTCYQDGARVALLIAAVSFGGSQQGQKIYSAALEQLKAKLPIR